MAGFTLIEVLVAVVIFSIGLLGIAGLQIAGLRYASGSQHRAAATMQAQNMTDRMYANLAGVDNGDYNVTGSMPGSYSQDCDNNNCSATELATFDLVAWNNTNSDMLPGGTGVVCIDSTPDDGDSSAWDCDNTGDVYAIKVQWTERAVSDEDREDTAGSGTLTRRLVMRFVPL